MHVRGPARKKAGQRTEAYGFAQPQSSRRAAPRDDPSLTTHGSPGCSVAYCRTLIAPGGPYSAGSCSSANGYGYDCSLLRLVTIACSCLLLLRKPENTQQGEAHKPAMLAATCCCCLFLVLFLLGKVKKSTGVPTGQSQRLKSVSKRCRSMHFMHQRSVRLYFSLYWSGDQR